MAVVDVRLPPTFTDEGLVAAIGTLDLAPSDDDNRRVRAVPAYLQSDT